MNQRSLWGGLSLIGGITAVPLLIAFHQTGWGAPGTAVYAQYELLNRLMAVALLFMAAGWVGMWQVMTGYGRWAALMAFIGLLAIAAGTAAEFWLYSDLPYDGDNLRQTAFAVVGVGGWLLDSGAMVVGTAVWRSRIWPRWCAMVLLLAFPIDMAAYFLFNSLFTTAALLALLIGFQLIRNGNVPEQVGTAVP
jgi:hypothetical protein